MAREGDWLDRLTRVVALHDRQPFAWGTSDCLNFVLDAAEAMTGRDPYPEDRRVSSEAEARANLKARGFRSVDAALAAAYERIPPAMAGTGDIVVLPASRRRLSCGIVVGPQILVRDPERLARLPRSAARRAYRVD